MTKTHYIHTPQAKRTYCGTDRRGNFGYQRRSRPPVVATDKAQVTCSRCQKAIEKWEGK